MNKTNKINKTFRLNPLLLEQAKKTLGYDSLTEAIEDTLQTAINNKKHWKLLQKSHGKLKNFRSLYD